MLMGQRVLAQHRLKSNKYDINFPADKTHRVRVTLNNSKFQKNFKF